MKECEFCEVQNEDNLSECVWCHAMFCPEHGEIMDDGPICQKCLDADDKSNRND